MGGAPAYRIAMEALLTDDGVDAVIALFIPPVVDRADEGVAFRITPISDRDAEAMIQSLRARALLDGSRGSAGR
jgi:hypothetical protein